MSGKDERILAFDFFGTLFDISSMDTRIGSIIGDTGAAKFLDTWRKKQLEYSYLLTVMGEYESFLKLTERALHYSADLHGVDLNKSAEEKLMDLWITPELYDDVIPSLKKLEHVKRTILSNGNPEMLFTGLERSGISGLFDAVISVEGAGTFKPHRSAYSLVTSKYGVKPEQVVFLSSNGWDIVGASHFGLYTVWVNRSGLPVENLAFKPSRIIGSLADLPEALREHY